MRNALSFALGAFQVDLGSVVYKDWEVHSFRLNDAYSIARKVFELPVLHPAPLHMNWQYGIDRIRLNRMLNAIVAKYDELDFGNLEWAYWHALCATPHIAGVHFGAAIEALQRRYIAANPTKIQTKIIADRSLWNSFSDEIESVITRSKLPDDSKAALRENIGSLNRVHQKAKMEALLREVGIELGPEEALAWKRRKDAAHGNEMEAGGELSLIQDNKLLKVVRRMLLRITNASDLYRSITQHPVFPGGVLLIRRRRIFSAEKDWKVIDNRLRKRRSPWRCSLITNVSSNDFVDQVISPYKSDLSFVRMDGRHATRIDTDELIERRIHESNNARLCHLIGPASTNDRSARHPRPRRGIDQYVVCRKPRELWFRCNASALPDRISGRFDLKWIAKNEDVHPDLNTKRRIGQYVEWVKRDDQSFWFERNGQHSDIDTSAWIYQP